MRVKMVRETSASCAFCKGKVQSWSMGEGPRRILSALALLFGIGLLAGALSLAPVSSKTQDLREISKRAWKGDTELFSYFQAIAEDTGALYAFDLLRSAELPPNVDLHLLGHVIGDELYKQKGIGGMGDCTQEFRNACSHSIVVGAFDEFGEEALPLITESCKRAPGGPGAYTMCFHGLGHGIFAYYGYELAPTIETCTRTGTKARHFREYQECVGGTIMELMGGGGHDRELWNIAREKYLHAANPLSPCDTDLIPADVKRDCYIYLTPRLFEYAGANLARPSERHFSEAFTYCDRIPADQLDNRRACFGGIGKEFIVLALDRDIRQVGQADTSALKTMRKWCSLAPHEEAHIACTSSVVSSLYWGGENPPDAAVSFCSIVEEGNIQADCFNQLFDQAEYYGTGKGISPVEFCSLVPSSFIPACRDRLSLEA